MRKYIFIIILLLAMSYALAIALAQVKLETALPPIAGQPSPGEGLPQYINYLFIFGLGLIAILALYQMTLGGITYILAAGNAAKVEDAKDTIKQALFGLGILLVSYLLLRTINPDLVNLKNPNLAPTQFQGAPTSGVIAPGQISTGQQCQKDADCTAGGSLGGQIVCQNGQCVELTTGGY